MADDTPIFDPDAIISPDVLNIQKQLADVQKKFNDLQDLSIQMSNEQLLLEAQRLAMSRSYLDLNKVELLTLIDLQELRARSLDEIEQNNMKAMIGSIRQRMAVNQSIVNSELARYEIEKAAALEKYVRDNKWGLFMIDTLEKQFGLSNTFLNTAKSISKTLSTLPFELGKSAIIWGTLIALASEAYNIFKRLDTAAWMFRSTMGFTRRESEYFSKIAIDLEATFGNVGVNVTEVYNSIKALTSELGSTNVISKDLIKSTALLKSQLGISTETSAGFLRNMAAISQTTAQVQEDTLYMTANMANAAGIPLGDIMGDIAKASIVSQSMMSRLPNIIIRTATEARRLNTTIDAMAKSSRSMLDFTESMNSEMEASVLIGRNINLQRAREMAYRRDLEGATKEILDISRKIDFENLDVFQQEAFARATGRSVDELNKMLLAQRQIEKAKGDPTLAAKVKAYEELRDSNAAFAKSNVDNYKMELQRLANQERLVSIQNKWNQLLFKISTFALPIIEKGLDFIANNLELIILLTGGVGNVFSKLGTMLNWIPGISSLVKCFNKIKLIFVDIVKESTAIMTPINAISTRLSYWKDNILSFFKSFSKVGNFFTSIGTKISNIFSFISGGLSAFPKIFTVFGRYIPVIGQIITIAQILYNSVKDIYEAFTDPSLDFRDRLEKGLFALPKAIWNAIVAPFINAGKWILDKLGFGGHSPSKVGLSIVKGLTSVGDKITTSLTSPFQSAFSDITSGMQDMNKIADQAYNNVSSIMAKPIETNINSAYVSPSTITPDENRVGLEQHQEAQSIQTSTKESVDNNNSLLKSILDGINTLNANLESGKIGIFMDGQLLSATLSRQTEFRRGFGVNNA